MTDSHYNQLSQLNDNIGARYPFLFQYKTKNNFFLLSRHNFIGKQISFVDNNNHTFRLASLNYLQAKLLTCQTLTVVMPDDGLGIQVETRSYIL
jgi:hypothetical protein